MKARRILPGLSPCFCGERQGRAPGLLFCLPQTELRLGPGTEKVLNKRVLNGDAAGVVSKLPGRRWRGLVLTGTAPPRDPGGVTEPPHLSDPVVIPECTPSLGSLPAPTVQFY